eukprot:1057512-Amphidinium_carterae.1
MVPLKCQFFNQRLGKLHEMFAEALRDGGTHLGMQGETLQRYDIWHIVFQVHNASSTIHIGPTNLFICLRFTTLRVVKLGEPTHETYTNRKRNL